MRSLIKNAPVIVEFWLVVTIGFGLLIASSFWLRLTQQQMVITDQSLSASMAFELVLLGIVAWILRLRGWSFRALGFRLTWRLTVIGLILFLGVTLAVGVLICATRFFGWEISLPSARLAGLSAPAIIGISVVNPIFEETLVTGYIIQRLASKGSFVAILVSSVVRFAYHTYLGPIALFVLLLGAIFGAVYWQFRQLWPIVMAHSLMDLLILFGATAIA